MVNIDQFSTFVVSSTRLSIKDVDTRYYHIVLSFNVTITLSCLKMVTMVAVVLIGN